MLTCRSHDAMCSTDGHQVGTQCIDHRSSCDQGKSCQQLNGGCASQVTPFVLSDHSEFYIFLIYSNNKLFHRAVGIIKDVAMVTETAAKNCLLRSIYEVDQLPSNLNRDDIIGHIQKATRMDKVKQL